MWKRMGVVVIVITGFFSILVSRIAWISSNQKYQLAAIQQSEVKIPFNEGRGNIYDTNFIALTSAEYEQYGLFSPGKESYREWFESIQEGEKAQFYENIQRHTPFLVILADGDEKPEHVFYKTKRYWSYPIAPHLIGYLNAEGEGVSGLEKAGEQWMPNASTQTEIWSATNAYGGYLNTLHQEPFEFHQKGSGQGLMLTLDAAIQRGVEAIAKEKMKQGAIVVMESATGKVRASVSMPLFHPDHVGLSIKKEDGSLLNRPFYAYNVGSVIKPLIAAKALSMGFSPYAEYECSGSYQLNGHTYKCAYGIAHGTVNMQKALEESCNTYFISLGLQLGAHAVHEIFDDVNFGKSTSILPGLQAAKGNMPSAEQLQDQGQLASISFGQGSLLATPIQVAAAINVFANNGIYIEPSFVQGFVNEYDKTIVQSLYHPIQKRVLDTSVVSQIQKMMASVIEQGIGKAANPVLTTAAGKTGTAQTGRSNENGEEKLDAWFVGFYPAQNPRYTVVVLLDDGTYESKEAAKIFGNVVDVLYALDGFPKADEKPPLQIKES